MSNTTNKASTKGVRYTDAQKKEVVDFTVNYNSANGRGGQSKASEKFNVSQLTISGWLKAAGAPSSKSAKAPKAPKAPKASKAAKPPKVAKAPKAKDGAKLGSRYTPEQKQEVIDFVVAYNKANGRGGPSNASKKFGISPLTVVAWLKAAGESTVKNAPRKGAKVAKVAKVAKTAKATKGAAVAKSNSSSGDFNSKLNSLLALSTEIAATETKLAQLQAKFSSLKASL
jgi:transposase-like protein